MKPSAGARLFCHSSSKHDGEHTPNLLSRNIKLMPNPLSANGTLRRSIDEARRMLHSSSAICDHAPTAQTWEQIEMHSIGIGRLKLPITLWKGVISPEATQL